MIIKVSDITQFLTHKSDPFLCKATTKSADPPTSELTNHDNQTFTAIVAVPTLPNIVANEESTSNALIAVSLAADTTIKDYTITCLDTDTAMKNITMFQATDEVIAMTATHPPFTITGNNIKEQNLHISTVPTPRQFLKYQFESIQTRAGPFGALNQATQHIDVYS
jgi:hypothetical protein